MERLLISPPFGSYISTSFTTSVLGSFTVEPRPGLFCKSLQFFLDNYHHPVKDGYRNRIGLRNPGVYNIPYINDLYIYSVVGLKQYDWDTILLTLEGCLKENSIIVELNLGCPNVHEYGIRREIIKEYCRYFKVIAKLPPTEKFFPIADMCAEEGIDYFHCSNTVPSELGGISGYPLKHINLPLVTELAKRCPHIPIIAGGGIYEWQDILDYRRAGAIYFSTSTVWLNPFKAYKLVRRFHKEGI